MKLLNAIIKGLGTVLDVGLAIVVMSGLLLYIAGTLTFTCGQGWFSNYLVCTMTLLTK